MRTTLDIEGPVLKDLRALAAREGGTLGGLASRLLAEALAARRHARPAAAAFTWRAKPMNPRVDLEDKDALYAVLDAPDAADRVADR
ncbi:MAG: antitoxin [Vicinamibacteria bacterium]|nr:antitoxin [Vicinamibacteria bacterium]